MLHQDLFYLKDNILNISYYLIARWQLKLNYKVRFVGKYLVNIGQRKVEHFHDLDISSYSCTALLLE